MPLFVPFFALYSLFVRFFPERRPPFMRVCAVICEYNPFHLGHAYHLRAAREASGADYVLCPMSGALTQRGAFRPA